MWQTGGKTLRHVIYADQTIIRKMFHACLSIYVYLCMQFAI